MNFFSKWQISLTDGKASEDTRLQQLTLAETKFSPGQICDNDHWLSLNA